jgi:hypothetical protein
MVIYERGETFVHRVTIRDRNNAKTNPSSVSDTIEDPCGHILVNQASMASDATGEYYYNWAIPSTATFGRYRTKVEATSSSGNISIFKDEFFVLPRDIVPDVRITMGISDAKSISDEDLAHIIWDSYLWALRDVHRHHYEEKPDPNPDTGETFDGTNTTFQTKHYPIADINGDGSVTGWGQQSCGTDISGRWIDSSGQDHNVKITVTNARNGEITITQIDGTAIPSDNEGVYLDYWSEYWGFDSDLFWDAVVRLAAHTISKRFTSLDKVTIADIRSNNPLIVIDPDIYWNEYQRYLQKYREPVLGGI